MSDLLGDVCQFSFAGASDLSLSIDNSIDIFTNQFIAGNNPAQSAANCFWPYQNQPSETERSSPSCARKSQSSANRHHPYQRQAAPLQERQTSDVTFDNVITTQQARPSCNAWNAQPIMNVENQARNVPIQTHHFSEQIAVNAEVSKQNKQQERNVPKMAKQKELYKQFLQLLYVQRGGVEYDLLGKCKNFGVCPQLLSPAYPVTFLDGNPTHCFVCAAPLDGVEMKNHLQSKHYGINSLANGSVIKAFILMLRMLVQEGSIDLEFAIILTKLHQKFSDQLAQAYQAKRECTILALVAEAREQFVDGHFADNYKKAFANSFIPTRARNGSCKCVCKKCSCCQF